MRRALSSVGVKGSMEEIAGRARRASLIDLAVPRLEHYVCRLGTLVGFERRLKALLKLVEVFDWGRCGSSGRALAAALGVLLSAGADLKDGAVRSRLWAAGVRLCLKGGIRMSDVEAERLKFFKGLCRALIRLPNGAQSPLQS
ncbi:MAG: hypothetical protein ACUVQ5_03740 [Candidatus Methanomethylicaceae archaeon]